mmetsp:Transcript_74091/g.176479  ORF Transcript_74091/g.176479 Transcript_74091/m.176479 type:complete len:534 (+) Transcript_74091:97-1698(+)
MNVPNPAARIVLTGQQEAERAWQKGSGPGKYWEDKPNAGFSGTPLWKLHAERDARLQAEAAAAASSVKIPEGFVKREAEWYWSDKRQVFFNASDGKHYVWDEVSKSRVEVYEAKTYELVISPGFVCHEKAKQVRHVIVRDLARAATALRISLDHFDKPCAMYALYEGHRGGASGNVCTDFCAKHLHGKLLPKLTAFRGYWDDARLEAALQASFEELDAEFAEKHPGTSEGCSAAVALVTGNRLVVASLGDVSCTVCMRGGEVVRLMQAHAVPDPDKEDDEDDDDDAAGSSEAAHPPIRWTRAFGDLDYKVAGKTPLLTATPDVKVTHLQHKHHGFAFICRNLYASIGGSPAVSTMFRRSAGRPRMAAGALVDAAVQWLGEVGADNGLGSVVAFFDKVDSGEGPASKKRKTSELTQVRARHILLKHKECKSVVDKVRNKQVKRTRGEAERLLRGVLEETDGEKEHKLFSQRCRELSECQSCLKAGDLAGDLGWIKRGSCTYGDAFEASVFALQINQMSDLIDSDHGVHVVLRTA